MRVPPKPNNKKPAGFVAMQNDPFKCKPILHSRPLFLGQASGILEQDCALSTKEN